MLDFDLLKGSPARLRRFGAFKEGKAVCPERPGAGKNDRPLDGVFQLPYIARPRIGLEPAHRLGGQPVDVFDRLPAVLFQEMIRQQGDVFFPVPQRRQRNLDDVDPIEEVFPEPRDSQ